MLVFKVNSFINLLDSLLPEVRLTGVSNPSNLLLKAVYTLDDSPVATSKPTSPDPCPLCPAGIMQQFAISEATLFGWNSMDGESIGAGSNHGSVAHLSEVNQESITSRGTVVLF